MSDVEEVPDLNTQMGNEVAPVKSVHYYYVPVATALAAAGLPVNYLCGRRATRPLSPATARRPTVVGGLMVMPEKRDCPDCVAAFERGAASR